MFPVGRLQRYVLALEILVAVVLIGIVSVNALRRMDYLGDETMQHIRMTDASRTAYVAKNIAEGRGYTTNDLPAALIDFYAQQGKLHDEHWVNADRFPFGAYATAVLYKVTGTTSWEMGVLGYNLLFFLAFLVLLYLTASSIWADKYAGLFAVTIALLHPYTFYFLYWKDGDMLFLTTACMALLVRYYRVQPGQTSRPLAIGLGTILAFVFLARPNLGLPLLLVVGVGILRRLVVSRRTKGIVGALRHHLSRELLIPITVIVWCIPFVIHSMTEWGQPVFSANNLYQLPLGTRYGMGTDTWWKYTEPGQLPTLGLLAKEAGGELLTKFTTSWIATVRHIVSSHALELLLATGLFVWLGSNRAAEPAELRRRRPFQMVAWVMLFAITANVVLLPLYGYQSYSYRHYLSFGLPLLWIAAGRAVSLIVEHLGPTLGSMRSHVRAHYRWYLLAVIVGVLVWNLGTSSPLDAQPMFVRTSKFVGSHWLAMLLLFIVLLFRKWILRPPWFPRVVVLMFSLVYACYRPSGPMKRANYAFFALDDRVWDSMRERKGLVSSFALQNEVAWNTDRKNIPAPEWPMHIYSFLFDHQLEVEDLYIESADAMLANAFATAAPGFEGYARLQRYRTLPGYDVAFHTDTVRGYPRFRIRPWRKGSTVFKLVDREAVKTLRRSPSKILVGDPSNVIYTAHGWEDYYQIEGKPVVAGTNITRARYTASDDGPYEDSSITLFVDDRRPVAADFEFYAAGPSTYQFYWNLDLYAYDRPRDRASHKVGSVTATGPGWQKVRLEIPAKLLRKGLNKLGFRTERFAADVLCPAAMSADVCTSTFQAEQPIFDKEVKGTPPRVIRAEVSEIQYVVGSLFAHSLELIY